MTRERFIDLVRVEQEPLRRFLLGLCSGDGALADDIAQDALVRAYVASGSFLGLSKFRTWLFRIAYNCYIDHRRRPAAAQTDLESREALHLSAPESADDSFRYQQLYQALDRIDDKEKAVIVLFYFEDRPIKEIAAILGMPAGTVKYHLSMGRTHLKKYLRV
ncbi:MAG: sigma-70 family RNA polymerase sigma factor [Bacteroidales bacterium]|nr:sigma-70 family RNA polymerase sigma factor [Bacteroidales bacterium]